METLYSAAQITYVAYCKHKTEGDFFVICVKDMEGWYNNFYLRPNKIKPILTEMYIKDIKESIGKLLLLDVTDNFYSGKLPTIFKIKPTDPGIHTDNHIYNRIDSQTLWEVGDNGL